MKNNSNIYFCNFFCSSKKKHFSMISSSGTIMNNDFISANSTIKDFDIKNVDWNKFRQQMTQSACEDRNEMMEILKQEQIQAQKSSNQKEDVNGEDNIDNEAGFFDETSFGYLSRKSSIQDHLATLQFSFSVKNAQPSFESFALSKQSRNQRQEESKNTTRYELPMPTEKEKQLMRIQLQETALINEVYIKQHALSCFIVESCSVKNIYKCVLCAKDINVVEETCMMSTNNIQNGYSTNDDLNFNKFDQSFYDCKCCKRFFHSKCIPVDPIAFASAQILSVRQSLSQFLCLLCLCFRNDLIHASFTDWRRHLFEPLFKRFNIKMRKTQNPNKVLNKKINKQPEKESYTTLEIATDSGNTKNENLRSNNDSKKNLEQQIVTTEWTIMLIKWLQLEDSTLYSRHPNFVQQNLDNNFLFGRKCKLMRYIPRAFTEEYLIRFFVYEQQSQTIENVKSVAENLELSKAYFKTALDCRVLYTGKSVSTQYSTTIPESLCPCYYSVLVLEEDWQTGLTENTFFNATAATNTMINNNTGPEKKKQKTQVSEFYTSKNVFYAIFNLNETINDCVIFYELPLLSCSSISISHKYKKLDSCKNLVVHSSKVPKDWKKDDLPLGSLKKDVTQISLRLPIVSPSIFRQLKDMQL